MRRTVYLGEYGSPESRAEYARLVTDPSPNTPAAPAAGPTVAELLLAYLTYATGYYRDVATGEPSGYLDTVKLSARAIREPFAALPIAEFRPRHLTAVRDKLVASGLSRNEVNRRIGVAKKIFRWGMGADLTPPDVYHRLAAVEGLRAGRTTAPDRPRVRPADAAHVEAALPAMPPAVAALVALERVTAARCGELCSMRVGDVDRADPAAWVFRPTAHKGGWRGKERVVLIDPRAQEILAPWLLKAGGPGEFVFSPARAEAERNAARTAARKTPRWNSHMARNARNRVPAAERKSPPATRYTTRAVRQAVARACRRAGVPAFRPHQIRHLAAHEIRAALGIDVARAVLGHTLAAMSEHYSREVDRGLAMKAVAALG